MIITMDSESALSEAQLRNVGMEWYSAWPTARMASSVASRRVTVAAPAAGVRVLAMSYCCYDVVADEDTPQSMASRGKPGPNHTEL